MSSARVAAASTLEAPKGLTSRTMPRQARKPCSGWERSLQDQVAQRRGRRSDLDGVAPDPLDGPVGMAPVARRHVILHGRVLAIAAGAQMGGDTLTPGVNLHGAGREPNLDGFLREAVGHAVIVPVDIDMIIDTDPANAPLGKDIGLDRQGFEHRPVELFEELAPRHAEPADRPFVVETDQQLADRLVQLRQAVEDPVPEAPQDPALHDQHARLDLGLVAGGAAAASAGWRCRNAPPSRRRSG